MYQTASSPRWSQRVLDRPPAVAPSAAAEQALSRVRKILTGYLPGMPLDTERWQMALAAAQPTPARELERLFALGFLHWVGGNLASAEAVLDEAVNRGKQDKATAALGEAAYWQARVRVQLGRADAVGEYESVLRTLGGSPQATAWFIDLLWRVGRVDRAEQVWKSVKTNKRVTGCDEGPLLEARASLRRGEISPAERVLNEAAPVNGVVQVERSLLLAWVATVQKQADKALSFLKQAEQGPYPAAALKVWRRAVERRLKGETPPLDSLRPGSFLLGDLYRGHLARLAGQNDLAAAAYRQALTLPFAQPFAHYGLACLSQEDFAVLLAGQPGLYLALRCRARLALERFRKREITPTEFVEVLQQARNAGFQDVAAGHFKQIADLLQIKQPEKNALLKTVADQALAGNVIRRNVFRAALEQTVKRLPGADALALIQEWSQLDWVANDADLARLLGRQMLRLLLLDRNAANADALPTVQRLLPADPLLMLGRSLLEGHSPLSAEPGQADDPQAPAMARILRAAAWLAQHAGSADAAAVERWREEVRELRSGARLRGLAQALLVQEAAQRGDAGAVAALLDEADYWRAFRAGPPQFVSACVDNVALAQPGKTGLRKSLARWVKLWEPLAQGERSSVLAGFAGLATTKASSSDAPPGVDAAAWFLHRATRLLGSDDAESLACVRRALAQKPDLLERAEGAAVREALPDLERRARAQRLADVLRLQGKLTWPAVMLVDAADLLDTFPEGRAILQAAEAQDSVAARNGLDALAERSDLPPRLVHHLAVIELRTAETMEEGGDPDAAGPCWRRTWCYWLRHFAGKKDDPVRQLLFDHLLGVHRQQTNSLLAREVMEPARRHWKLVHELPGRAGVLDEELGKDLADRVGQFKDKLATEYLVTTREAMRYGEIPEGCHADYDKGLSYLRRLLSLDPQNVRLLTALVEICGEWFLDLYNTHAGRALLEQVERFTPFATQLLRLVEDRPADLAARAVLSDFYKFRGFVQRDQEQKLALYREALRLNPGNNNVRDLLAELDGVAQPSTTSTDEQPSQGPSGPPD
jgi:tetratricopeptide (TPR) repeat protein